MKTFCTLWFLFLFVILKPSHAEPFSRPGEIISVGAYARTWVQPDTARLTFLLKSSGDSATTVNSKSLGNQRAITEAVKKIDPEAKILLRGQSFVAKKGSSRTIAKLPSSSVKGLSLLDSKNLDTFLAVQTSQILKIGEIIDAALGSGAHSLAELNYILINKAPILQKLNSEASKKAKRKASAIAAGLGVKLGKILSYSTTEDSSGKLDLIRKTQGNFHQDWADVDLKVHSSLIYQIDSGSIEK